MKLSRGTAAIAGFGRLNVANADLPNMQRIVE